MTPRIDLHMHSSESDGTEDPATLVRSAAVAGLDVLALTDHDRTSGWAAAAAEARALGLAFVPGEEITARTADGVTVHLLSYLHDPDAEPLRATTERTRRDRAGRARRMVERLSADYPIHWSDVVRRTAPGATVGRPHIADALVDVGVVPDRAAAFAGPLSTHAPYYVRLAAPPAEDVVGMVLAAGGVPVLAHPAAASRGRTVSDDALERLVDAGLAGLEIGHRENPPEARRRLAAFAAAHDLIVTGSSDYHGAGKPNRPGENLTDPAQLARIEERGRGTVVRP